MFDAKREDCAKFTYLGVCHLLCDRMYAHVKPTGERKERAERFREECTNRYNMAGGDASKDFA